MQSKADSELVELTRLGDKEAFGWLILRYEQLARRVAYRLVRDVEVAQELTQEAMLQAYLSLNRLQKLDSFRSWLYGIVLNVCRSYLRDQKLDFFSLENLTGGLRFEVLALADADSNPPAIAEARELHRKVMEAVQVLPAKTRITTLLFYFEELSLQEIAAILGISVVAVKGRLHKGRQRLKQQLLATYPEAVYSSQANKLPGQTRTRNRKMLKATIMAIQPSKTTAHNVVVLLDESRQRILPIWIGRYEADCIGIGLNKTPVSRPLAYNFMANIIEAGGGKLEAVQVARLANDTFYGIAKFRFGDRVQEIDCRPSDALALATITDSPIFVAEEVFQQAGIIVPENAVIRTKIDDYTPSSQSMPAILPRQESQAGGSVANTQENFAQPKQQLLESLFGELIKPKARGSANLRYRLTQAKARHIL